MQFQRVVQRSALPIVFLSLAVGAHAQQPGAGAGGFGTIAQGAAALLALIRIVAGTFAVAAFVFAGFRFAGRDMVGGAMGVTGALFAALIAANAQTIVNSFYSTTG